MTKYMNVDGYAGYRVGDDGSVWSCWRKGSGRKSVISDSWKRLKAAPDGGGYLTVSLYRNSVSKTYRVHRLVLLAFVGPCPKGMEACHDNGNESDCRVDNLRWDTKISNNADRRKHGTLPCGERHYSSTLSREQVVSVRSRLASGEPATVIANDLNVNKYVVYRIGANKTYKSVV